MACGICAHEDAARVAVIENHPRVVEYTPLPDHIIFIAVVFYVLDVARGLASESETGIIKVGGS